MDNFFEKITLYDLVGYAIPGTLLLCVGMKDIFIAAYEKDIIKDYTLYVALITLILGYCVGVISSSFVLLISEKILRGRFRTKNVEFYKIGYEAIAKALRQAGVMQEDKKIDNEEDVFKYLGYIYGDVQVTKQFKRIHNYSSIQLFCENMALTCSVGGVITTLLFIFQANLFCNRKNFYAVAWFVKKYS